MTSPTPGALFVVGGRPYVDSQTLHNLTRTHSVSPLSGGWRVQGPEGTVECLLSERTRLPDQRGALYEARATAGVKVSDACATWLAGGAARIAGKYADWPGATACGCSATCGCDPCKQRHHHAESAAEDELPSPTASGKVSHEDAAQYVLDAVPFQVKGYIPETEARPASGFYLHLYLPVEDGEQRASTFEVIDKNNLRVEWHVEPESASRRSQILRTIDLLIQEAYDEENHRDPG